MRSCPNCGAELPSEAGQARPGPPRPGPSPARPAGPRSTWRTAGAEGIRPGRGRVEGEPVTTEASLDTERHDYFSGEETVAGVMDELEDKPGGPDGSER